MPLQACFSMPSFAASDVSFWLAQPVETAPMKRPVTAVARRAVVVFLIFIL